ncbi:hypothetical protein RIF29_26820 [Crotalaria pallida]|uniref:Uncharacterized protein n=1 Tax=Crotalaria pallida TaxID=3830 RepID=A0AAN9I010_CROPI
MVSGLEAHSRCTLSLGKVGLIFVSICNVTFNFILLPLSVPFSLLCAIFSLLTLSHAFSLMLSHPFITTLSRFASATTESRPSLPWSSPLDTAMKISVPVSKSQTLALFVPDNETAHRSLLYYVTRTIFQNSFMRKLSDNSADDGLCGIIKMLEFCNVPWNF